MTRKKVLVLGSTGSIGCQTLDVIERNKNLFEIVGLANNNNDLLYEQSQKFNVSNVAVADKSKYNEKYKGWYWGDEGVEKLVRESDADIVVVAITGAKSLKPTLAAIESGKDIALASKEVMVMAGELINKKVKEFGVKLFPIDSEHNAIWQALRSGKDKEIEKIILTCSGGPFAKKEKKDFEKITVKEALNHPKWKMGERITIDSATLMNKGLEFIEAKWLFNLKAEEIEVVVHPQSLIHSAIQFHDGSIIAQIGDQDMRIAIQYALSYPNRIKNDFKRVDWNNLDMNFSKPDLDKFPCLRLAYEAVTVGGTMPIVLNAADEIVVDLFLKEKIKFTEIPVIIEKVMKNHKIIKNADLEEIMKVDEWARKEVMKMTKN
jgi:1-deoxy-D-xylulose-5-phosphate reductoisomerase